MTILRLVSIAFALASGFFLHVAAESIWWHRGDEAAGISIIAIVLLLAAVTFNKIDSND